MTGGDIGTCDDLDLPLELGLDGRPSLIGGLCPAIAWHVTMLRSFVLRALGGKCSFCTYVARFASGGLPFVTLTSRDILPLPRFGMDDVSARGTVRP